jgi:hypothetical protein
MPNRWEQPTVYLASGDPETENVASLQYPGQLGIRFTIERPGGTSPSKRYQLIRTDSTMSVSPFAGAVAWWSDKTAYLVTTSPTALGRGRIAGVFRTAITKGNYGCVQIGGKSPDVKFVDAPTAVPSVAGLQVFPSATAGKADAMTAGSTPGYPTLGVSSGVYNAANATADVDLDVPETT